MSSKKSNGLTRRDFLKLAGATVAASALAGCAKKEEGADATSVAAEPVELIYHYGARVALTDLELVQDAMNEILEPKINATMVLSPIVGWGDLTQKMQLKNAAGEKYDICFVSSWANPYYDNIKNGVLVELLDGPRAVFRRAGVPRENPPELLQHGFTLIGGKQQDVGIAGDRIEHGELHEVRADLEREIYHPFNVV